VSGYVPAELREQVREHFANCCAYCQTAESLTVVTFKVEHVLPRSAGGKTTLANLCFACPTCNRCKADRTTASDPATRQEVPLFHPHQHVWSAHFAWNDDATEIVALTPIARATIAALKINRPQLVRLRRMWTIMGEHPPKLPQA